MWTLTGGRCMLTGLGDLLEPTFMLSEMISEKKVDNKKNYQKVDFDGARYMLTGLGSTLCLIIISKIKKSKPKNLPSSCQSSTIVVVIDE